MCPFYDFQKTNPQKRKVTLARSHRQKVMKTHTLIQLTSHPILVIPSIMLFLIIFPSNEEIKKRKKRSVSAEILPITLSTVPSGRRNFPASHISAINMEGFYDVIQPSCSSVFSSLSFTQAILLSEGLSVKLSLCCIMLYPKIK